MALGKATHVVFDLDGTILNTEDIYTEVFDQVTMELSGKRYDMTVKMKMMGRKKEEAFVIYREAFGISESDEVIDTRVNELLFKQFSNAHFLPGVKELVEHFHKQGIPMAVATGSDQESYNAKTKHCREFFDKYFETVVLSCDPEVVKGKPAPDIFLVTARRFKNPPASMSSVLVFEDATNGVEAANNAGMLSVWVPCLPLDTSKIPAHLVLKSLEDFQPEVFGLPPRKS